MEEARRKKSNIEKAGQSIFWFTDDSWYGNFPMAKLNSRQQVCITDQ